MNAIFMGLLSTSRAQAAAGGGGGGGGNVIVDLWQTFEFDTFDITNLANQDNWTGGGSDPVWAIFGTTPTTSTSGERATFSTMNSTADSGTRGMAIDNDVGGRIQLDMLTYPPTQSVGFWFFSSPQTNTFNPVYGVGAGNDVVDNTNSVVYIKLTNTAGTNTLALYGATTSSDITVSGGTWYWITVKAIRDGATNGASLMQVFNTAGTLVGSVSCNGRDNSLFYHILGGAGTSSGISYYDDLVVDKTDATFPLGP